MFPGIGMNNLIVFGLLYGVGGFELIVIGVIAVLLFGKNLPEVAQKVGKYYYDFTRGLREMQQDMQMTIDSAGSEPSQAAKEEADDYEVTTAPRFEPPPSEPTATPESSIEEKV